MSHGTCYHGLEGKVDILKGSNIMFRKEVQGLQTVKKLFLKELTAKLRREASELARQKEGKGVFFC